MGTDSVERLSRAVLAAPADHAGRVVAEEVRSLVQADAVQVRLPDRAGVWLHPVGSAGEPDDDGLDLWAASGLPAGEACRDGTVLEEHGVDGSWIHVPMVVRGTRYGLLALRGAGHRPDDETLLGWAAVAATLVDQAGRSTDFFEIRRRSSSFSVSAELQWQLLPPASVATEDVELHALIEPAPRVTSDLFDWSLDGDQLWVAVLDAEGRGLSASAPAATALAALRHGRRSGLPLEDQLGLADQAVYDQFRGASAVDAVVITLSLLDGRAQGVAAAEAVGVPTVFRKRAGQVDRVDLEVYEALGRFERSRYRSVPVDLVPGDEVLLVSDGGPGADDPRGEPFGTDRIAEVFGDSPSPAVTPRRLLDRLRRHRDGDVAQDATAVALAWHP